LRFGKTDDLHACPGRFVEEAKNRPRVGRQRVGLPALRKADA
jgi:hypothetical protein